MKKRAFLSLIVLASLMQACAGLDRMSPPTTTPTVTPAESSQPFPGCEKLKASLIPELDLEVIGSTEAFLDWAKTQPRFANTKFRFGESTDGARSVDWDDDYASYAVDFGAHQDRRSIVTWAAPYAPSLAQLLSCLGRPQFYRAYNKSFVDARLFHCDLWFPERGWMFDLDRVPLGQRPTLDTTVVQAWVGRSGSALRMSFDVFQNIKTEAEAKPVLDQLKPWPARLDDLRIDEL